MVLRTSGVTLMNALGAHDSWDWFTYQIGQALSAPLSRLAYHTVVKLATGSYINIKDKL